MRFLLDTHVFLWFIAGNTQLPSEMRTMIESSDNQRFISTASLWEIAIKTSLGKLDMQASFDELVPRYVIENDMTLLPISR